MIYKSSRRVKRNRKLKEKYGNGKELTPTKLFG